MPKYTIEIDDEQDGKLTEITYNIGFRDNQDTIKNAILLMAALNKLLDKNPELFERFITALHS